MKPFHKITYNKSGAKWFLGWLDLPISMIREFSRIKASDKIKFDSEVLVVGGSYLGAKHYRMS